MMGTTANSFPAALLLVLLFFNPSDAASSPSSLLASIDCGAAKPYTDDIGISWVSDSTVIKTGRVETVPNATDFSEAMRNLRVFPTGKKNCYSLSVPGTGQFVLLRASFYYGNYDGKDSPPTFDIEFDGNSWATVHTSSDSIVFEEAIYVVSGDSTSFCLVQTNPPDLPFVSAIELRALSDNMYSHFDHTAAALVLSFRKAAGLAQLVRYPDDPYDRIWLPYQTPNSLEVVRNQASDIATDINDSPPAGVLQAAVTPPSGGMGITMSAPLPSDTVRAYLNFYFTEVDQLSAADNRTLQIFVDDTAVSDQLVPPFGGVIEFYDANFSASSKTQIDLRPTKYSTLPPVISAMEAYVIVPLGGGGGGGGSAPAPVASDSTPSDATPSDSSSAPSDLSPDVEDQTRSPPAKNAPVSIFGGGTKGKPSFGSKLKASMLVEVGGGLVFPLLWMLFV